MIIKPWNSFKMRIIRESGKWKYKRRKKKTLSQMFILVSRREERIIDGDLHVDCFMHRH